MSPIYLFGIPSGNDQSQHYQFAWTVYNSVRGGDIYPSFAADTNHGFGDYGLRFYPPLTYYVLAGLRAVTGDWYFATLIALTLVFFVGALGVYLWTRESFDERTALIAAALYTFIPYHLNEIYNNFLFAELFATAVLPFCFLYLHRTLQRPDMRNAIGLALSCSLLVVTHLPLTIMGVIAMTVYAAFSLRKADLLRQLGWIGGAAAATVALTAFYWSRWVPELAWITHNSQKYFSTTWDYRTNFLFVASRWAHLSDDFLNLWFADLMLFVAILVMAPAAIMLAIDEEKRKKLLPLTAVFALATLLTTPLTAPIWDRLRILQKLQFPWRWLAVVSIVVAVFGSAGLVWSADQVKLGNKPALKAVMAVALASIAFMGVLIVKGPVYVSREKLNADIASFENSTGCDCWWPVWAKSEAFGQTEKVVAGGREVSITSWSPRECMFSIPPGDATSATVKAWYYPRWIAQVNGVEQTPHSDENGRLTIDVPTAAANVSVRFVEPGYVIAATVISLLAWIAMLFTGALLLLKSRQRTSET
ncbi:MAG TPA: 6-pyruvoyl-tetrahydropterin synthase-related protein [Pyrinomonadaceae bacterium]|nr:6-pyruvoyl-tetrahydropterin synthase-related protein [Pyrinomonadaceae bacterium]